MSCVRRCPVSLAQIRIRVVNDNRDSFSFVDKTGPTVTTDVKRLQSGISKAPLRPIKRSVRSSD